MTASRDGTGGPFPLSATIMGNGTDRICWEWTRAKFSLRDWVGRQTELCRVVVRKTDFPWLKRYAALIRPNPAALKEGIAGYEVALNFNGVAFEIIPRTASEIKGKAKFQLLSVNEAEHQRNPCRRLVSKRGSHWELASAGINLLELLT